MRSLALFCCLVVPGCGRFEATIPQATRPATIASPSTTQAPVAVQAASRPAAPPLVVSAEQIWKDYGQDLAAAEERYLNREIIVTGVKGKLEKDREGRYFLASGPFRTVLKSQPRPVQPQVHIGSVDDAARRVYQSAFNSSSASSAATTRPGLFLSVSPAKIATFKGAGQERSLTVRGKCLGTMKTPGTSPDFIIILSDCERVRPPASGSD